MKNRRNFYRILHVQPEAPAEIIKASYRSLMTKLNVHPDRGGEHDAAVLINQAYAVLSDPVKRKKYDETLSLKTSHAHNNTAAQASSEKSRNPASERPDHNPHFYQNTGFAGTDAQKRCLFCQSEIVLSRDKNCRQCRSPLMPVQSFSNDRICELFGRRTVPRISKTGALTVYPSWPHAGFPAWLRDLSRNGFCILTVFSPKTGQIIKINSEFLNGVARVVAVRPNGKYLAVHATFLTAEFLTKTGVFVAEKA